MKKFDLIEKKRELDSRRTKDTRETLGTRLVKVIVGLIGGFMLWSVFTTVTMAPFLSVIVNILIVLGVALYYFKSGVFSKN
ncbi:hypothetical protein [Fusibacter sp. JL216-2]|uniref:hypothetical protein n=1 Tax=Fusibacter sp. JL216-2 TaxID=3071453 RepID=UPI003D353D0E